MIGIVTDSCATVPEELVQALAIETVPYYVHTERGTLRDSVDMSPDAFYAWVKTATEWPTTANPSVGEYLAAYQHVVARGAGSVDGLVVICVTGAGSGGYQSALVARERAQSMLEGVPIEVVDTRMFGMGHGWAVIQAAREALQGAPLEKVADVARRTAAASYTVYTADTVEYLRRGGRIGRVQGMIGGALSLKPIIGIRDGMPASLGVARTRKAAYRRMLELMQMAIAAGSEVRVALMHVAAQDEAERLRPLLEAKYTVREWLVVQLSMALGVHSGPGTVGVTLVPADLPLG